MPQQKPEVVSFEVWFTTAPKDYDGFGTITLVEAEKSDAYTLAGDQMRKVGVLPENSQWQTTRYASGMYPCMTGRQVRELMGMETESDREELRKEEEAKRGSVTREQAYALFNEHRKGNL